MFSRRTLFFLLWTLTFFPNKKKKKKKKKKQRKKEELEADNIRDTTLLWLFNNNNNNNKSKKFLTYLPNFFSPWNRKPTLFVILALSTSSLKPTSLKFTSPQTQECNMLHQGFTIIYSISLSMAKSSTSVPQISDHDIGVRKFIS